MLRSKDLAARFEVYSDWRRRLSAGISRLHEWLSEQDLADAQTDLGIQQLLERLHQDRLVVAFVGLTLFPTILLFIVAQGFLSRMFDTWFSVRVSNSLSDAVQTRDLWTFRRDLASRDPNWLLIETDEEA